MNIEEQIYLMGLVKLSRSIPMSYWKDRLGAKDPSAPAWKRFPSAIQAGIQAGASKAISAATPIINSHYKRQANNYKSKQVKPSVRGSVEDPGTQRRLEMGKELVPEYARGGGLGD